MRKVTIRYIIESYFTTKLEPLAKKYYFWVGFSQKRVVYKKNAKPISCGVNLVKIDVDVSSLAFHTDVTFQKFGKTTFRTQGIPKQIITLKF